MNIFASAHQKYAGYYRVKVRRGDGSIRLDTGWFSNLITNAGLDMIGAFWGGYNQYTYAFPYLCAVGTGTTTPSITDTQLTTQVGVWPNTSGYGPSFNSTYVAGPPSYWSLTYTYVFNQGQIVANISEIGTGAYATSSAVNITTFSHALIMSGGTPTTISLTSQDILEVTFELRVYLNTTDTAYSTTISGTSYSGNIRMSHISSTNTNRNGIYPLDTQSSGVSSYLFGAVYNGSIGTVTQDPTGASTSIGTMSLGSYTPGSYTRSIISNSTISQANLSGGISAIMIECSLGAWQLSVTPAIPKDNTKIMTLNFAVSWARYP